MNKRVTVVGGGNLGVAIAGGLLNAGLIVPSDLIVTKRHPEVLRDLISRGVEVTSNNQEAIQGADYIIIALQPSQTEEALRQLAPVLNSKTQVVISVVTGFSSERIQSILGNEVSIYLAMPNTAVLIGESMTCISTPNGTKAQTEEVLSIFNTLGKALLIHEENMDSATVLGACGIAYALRYIRAASQGGIEIGFHSEEALLIAAQTVKGAAELLLSGHKHPESEIDKVTTPKGCTIAGLNEMEHQGFSSALIKGILTSKNKISVIAKG